MVHTQLAEVRKKKHILQTQTNENNDNNRISSNNDASSNVFSGTNLLKVVCETRTQIVNSTLDDDISLKGFELEKTPPVDIHSTEEKCTGDTETGEKISDVACKVTTPPSKKRKSDGSTIDLPSNIEFRRFGYLTPEKKTFKLDENLQLTPTHLTPTPDLDIWFIDDDDKRHCNNLINNLNNSPLKCSEEWLNKNFCQFKKFVTDNGMTRVKLLTNMWLKDGKQHSFPVSTPEDKYLPGVKARLDKDLQFKELNSKKSSFTEVKQIFSSLNYKITEILDEKEQNSVVASLKKVSACLMTSQKMYKKHFASYEKQHHEMFAEHMKLTMLKQETSEKNVCLIEQVSKLDVTVDTLCYQLRQ